MIFQRAQLLLGEEHLQRLNTINVIIFGVGGVGSWCAEALVRTGITHLTIVDMDIVAESNVNRQLMATTKTVGEVKVKALKQRLQEINPDADITDIEARFCEDTAKDFHLEDYDVIVDAIDSLDDKRLLIEYACNTSARFYSSMGAALKVDPTMIRVAEFWKVKGCPLARALRQRFKKLGHRPARKFLCVYSEEHRDATNGKGSIVQITGIFGFTLAGLIINETK